MTRTINLDLTDYMKRVNEGMLSLVGVSYSEVAKDIHGNVDVIRTAFEVSVPAEDFIRKTVAAQGFKERAALADDARDFNLRLAALALFARVTDGWVPLHGGGAIFADGVEAIHAIVPSKDENGIWGFEGRRVSSGELSFDGVFMHVSQDAHYEVLGGGVDISDAAAVFDRDLVSTPAMR